MPPLPTVLLRHDLPDGSHHFDWLLAMPTDPEGPLWGGRVALPSDQWSAAMQWELDVLPPHRRRYLQYEGPLSDNRGTVSRIDEGTVIIRGWSDQRIILDLAMKHCQGRVGITQVAATHWRAQMLPDHWPDCPTA